MKQRTIVSALIPTALMIALSLSACKPLAGSPTSSDEPLTGVAKELKDAGYKVVDESGEPTTTQVWELTENVQVTINDREKDGTLAIVSVDDQDLQGFKDGEHFWCEYSGGPSLQVALTKFDNRKADLLAGAPLRKTGTVGVREIPGTYCYVE